MFAKFIVALSILTALAIAAPTGHVTVEQCNTFGTAQCCNVVGQSNDPRVIAVAKHLDVVVSAADATLGLLCNPISAFTAGGMQCGQNAVCCQSSEKSSGVNVQCTPITFLD